jgi:cytochrome c553
MISARRIAARVLFVFGVSYAAFGSAQSGDPSAGEEKARMCAGCHGIAGWRNAYPAYSVPKLGGQHAEYLAAALNAYRSKERAHPTMQAVAASLSDQDIADLAAYFAGQSS